MKKFSDTYIFGFTVLMVILVATILAVISIELKPLQIKNIEIRKKRSILAAMNIPSTQNNAEQKFNNYITEHYLINTDGERISQNHVFDIQFSRQLSPKTKDKKLPVFIGQPDTAQKVYIFPLHGKGLWGAIYGHLALYNDLKTIYGVTFGHEEETPGLGSQISQDAFQEQFKGKKLFDNNHDFHSVKVVKQEVDSAAQHRVNAISGATITSKGVEDMIQTCISLYMDFIQKQKQQAYGK